MFLINSTFKNKDHFTYNIAYWPSILMPSFISLLLIGFPMFLNAKRMDTAYYRNITIFLNKPSNADAILGKWMTVEHNLEVEVYKQDGNFRAKIIWFKVEDTTRLMNTRQDEKNPNPKLRTRKWLGMEVLRSLKYNVEDDEWDCGIIYDAKHGRYWDSVAWINNNGLLKVKGYWVFRWISETLTFKRVS